MSQIAQFEKVFEDLDVKTEEMSSAMDAMSGTALDQGEVMELLNQMQAENGMAVGQGLAQAGQNGIAQPGYAQ